MQLTEKTRKGILLYLTEITQAEADKIANANASASSTVYNIWKKIRTGQPVELTTVTLAIAELAASKKPKTKSIHKRIDKITKQLSAA